MSRNFLISILGLIIIVSLIPMKYYPHWFRSISSRQFGMDLIQHCAVFAIIHYLFWRSSKDLSLIKITLIVVAMGALLELAQSLTGRSGSFSDFLADVAGVGFSSIFIVKFKNRK